jgi:2-haloacid dehalogenase
MPEPTEKANPLLDFKQFRALTFDCYGTLIDWESGILSAIRPVVQRHGCNLGDAEILRLYGELEPVEQKPYRRYREVLAKVMRALGQRLGFAVSDQEAQSLPESLKEWLPFPDSTAALARLGARYKLAIISNTDDEFFASSSRHLGIRFDEVVTAEQAKAYKPSLEPFRLALSRLGLTRNEVLHVGQSIYHDVIPAKSLGLATVLVVRRGFGAARAADGEPDVKVPDLKTLADLASC